MLRRGLVEGTAGNISAPPGGRQPRHHAVVGRLRGDGARGSRAGRPRRQRAAARRPGAVVGNAAALACYRAFDDIGSVIHSHPVWATMFAVAHQSIPACVDEFAVYCGGDIRCADYAASGTPDVGNNAVKALDGRAAALIANHGLVAVAPRPDRALHIRPGRAHRPDCLGCKGSRWPGARPR